jgi:predicted DNA-binding transcriptional regulator AlpA
MEVDLVGVVAVAEMLGVGRHRVYQLRATYSDWPEPVSIVGGRSIWARSDIQAWITRHPTRPPGRPKVKGRQVTDQPLSPQRDASDVPDRPA